MVIKLWKKKLQEENCSEGQQGCSQSLHWQVFLLFLLSQSKSMIAMEHVKLHVIMVVMEHIKGCAVHALMDVWVVVREDVELVVMVPA